MDLLGSLLTVALSGGYMNSRWNEIDKKKYFLLSRWNLAKIKYEHEQAYNTKQSRTQVTYSPHAVIFVFFAHIIICSFEVLFCQWFELKSNDFHVRHVAILSTYVEMLLCTFCFLFLFLFSIKSIGTMVKYHKNQ